MPILLCRDLVKRTEWKAVVDSEGFTLGCSDKATMPIPDSELEPLEALIQRQGDRFVLRDLAQKGRVFLNGGVTREGLLKDEDRIQVGSTLILFLEQMVSFGGQVELDPTGRSESAAMRSLGLAESGRPSEGSASRRGPRRKSPGRSIAITLGLGAFLAGVIYGLWVAPPAALDGGARQGSPPSPAPAEAPAKTSKSVPPPAPAPAPRDSAAGTEAGREALESLKSLLESPDPAVSRASVAGSTNPVVVASGNDPLEARRSLRRLCLDLAGRPPTRAEETSLLSLPPEARARGAFELPASRGPLDALKGPPDTWFRGVLGRDPSGVEALAARSVTADPVGFLSWISTLPEYARADFRRPASPRLQAASLIVDALDRPPSSEREVDALAATCGDAALWTAASRTLLHAPDAALPWGAETTGSWEDDLFRFLGRGPTETERLEIPTLLSAGPERDRRRWFLLALATHPDHGSY